MKTTSPLMAVRKEIDDRLTATRARYEVASGDLANVLGGQVFGYEEALRIIDAAGRVS